MKLIQLKKILYILVVIIIFSLPLFIKDMYQIHLIIQAGIYILLTSGLNLITGYVGLLSLAHAAFFGIGAYTSGLLCTRLSLPFLINFIAAGLIAALISYLFGLVSSRVRGSAFIIMSLALLNVLHLIVLNWVDFTGGQMGIGNIERANIFGFEFFHKVAFYYLVLVIDILCIYIIYRLVNSKIGRSWITIRQNEDLAKSIGINVFKYTNFSFVLGAFFAGLAGSLYAHYITFISPDLFLFAINTQILVMLIMGGKGTIMGPVIGAIIFSMLPEYLRMAKDLRMPIFGAILIIGVLFFPDGLMGFLNKLCICIRFKIQRNKEGGRGKF